jgi:hypothetical protein
VTAAIRVSMPLVELVAIVGVAFLSGVALVVLLRWLR